MKKILFAIGCIFTHIAAYSQTTVTFKPGSTTGEDAIVRIFDNLCVAQGHGPIPGDKNYGDVQVIAYSDWTYNALGCSGGTKRGLIRFSELSTIPTNAIITAATIKFYGIPNITSDEYDGSSIYSATPTNAWLRRVTSTWTESAITWNNQPTTTTVNQIAIPPSTTKWNWDWSTNATQLVSMVQDMVSNPATNYGFMLQLDDETHYRNVSFASSDHPDEDLWPELIVTYTLEECDPSFDIITRSNNILFYQFNAVNQSATNYYWTIDGTPAGASPNISHTFSGNGNHSVCLTISDSIEKECTECYDLCIEKINENSIGNFSKTLNSLKLIPNPTTNGWNVYFNALEQKNVLINLLDITGRLLQSHSINAINGSNEFYLSAGQLSKGVYIIEISSDNIKKSIKAIKN